jgi:hypothetical protein
MDRQKSTHSINEVIHKKVTKKLKAKGLSPVVPMANSPIGLGYHSRQEAIQQGSVEQPDTRQPDQARTRNQRINHDIDEYLEQLISSEMIDESFVPFYAKACHKLGISTINRLRLNALNGTNPQKLFAYKVKGALQSQAKREFESI